MEKLRFEYKEQKITLDIFYKFDNPKIYLYLNDNLIAKSKKMRPYDIVEFFKEHKTIIIKIINQLNKNNNFKGENTKTHKIIKALEPYKRI